METKAQYIQGYYRNTDKTETNKKEGNALIGATLMACIAAMFLIIFWQFTLIVAASSITGVATQKYFKQKNDPERLIVNTYWR